MAFEVRRDAATTKPTLVPLWISRELHAPDVPVAANGVVYAFQSGKNSTETRAAGTGRGAGRGGATDAAKPVALGTNAILYAFDAETGKQLVSFELDSFNHFTNPVVAGGSVYAVTWDGKLYAFGLKK